MKQIREALTQTHTAIAVIIGIKDLRAFQHYEYVLQFIKELMNFNLLSFIF